MNLLDSAQPAYILISLSSVPLLLLAIIPHIFPARLSGISPSARLSIPSISLTIWTIIRCGIAVLDRFVLLERRNLFCSIDAILVAALTTGMVAHIPAIALYRYRSPSSPSPDLPTTARNTICLIIVYAYSLLPCVPTLSAAISKGFTTSQRLAKWWGFYCIADEDWYRIARTIALLAPLVVTLPITVLIFSVLYSTSGHPSPHIHPSTKNWAQAIILFLIPIGIGSYVIIEQIIGWNDSWWFRAFEGLAGPVLALSLLFDIHIWQTYSYWIRFRRPPIPETNKPNTPLLSKSEISLHTPDHLSSSKRSSSFYVDKLEFGVGGDGLVPKRSVRFPPTPQQAEYIPNRGTMNSSRSKGQEGERVESLLPPPAKLKSSLRQSLLKPSLHLQSHSHISHPSGGIHAQSDQGMEQGLDSERSVHPHPHSINEELSPPTELYQDQDHIETLDESIPQVSIQQPTPVHISRYSTTSTSQSSPFQYQDVLTIYSNAPTDYAPESASANRSTVFPYTTSTLYTSKNTSFLPSLQEESDITMDENEPSAFEYMLGKKGLKRSSSLSTGYTDTSSKPGLGEMISTIGGHPPGSTSGISRSNTTSTSTSRQGAQSETSSIYSQPSIVDSYYGTNHNQVHVGGKSRPRRSSLAHRRGTSNFSSNNLSYMPNRMAPTPEDEEVIYFEDPHPQEPIRNYEREQNYDYDDEIEGTPSGDR